MLPIKLTKSKFTSFLKFDFTSKRENASLRFQNDTKASTFPSFLKVVIYIHSGNGKNISI